MSADPSLAIDVRAWCAVHLNFDGTAYRFHDGVDFESLRAAIQAAWLAGNYWLAFDIICRYGMDRVLCPRCTRRCPATRTLPAGNFVQPSGGDVPGPVWCSLCEDCCCDLMGIR